ncbi:hypothetical protein CPB84DRAFT_1312642 [Gymnopilus junonius]|uniref:Uncharacterized protein n=1 Tax=Gymnopilus junonius TaxID=109634 RepID=A0A9P5TLJ9_GYMJU|nr:hypothetical protein CPB84DRAFT_1312642 [Gymnopilus junonius]
MPLGGLAWISSLFICKPGSISRLKELKVSHSWDLNVVNMKVQPQRASLKLENSRCFDIHWDCLTRLVMESNIDRIFEVLNQAPALQICSLYVVLGPSDANYRIPKEPIVFHQLYHCP